MAEAGFAGAGASRRPLFERAHHPDNTIVTVGRARFGAGPFIVVAGPCAVESREQLTAAAAAVATAGAHLLRGGIFKPRTSPYSFRGLGAEAAVLLAEVGRAHGLGVVAEATSPDQVDTLERDVDMLQVGARNMQNFDLLDALAATERPVLLKRGFGNTVDEWLHAAEYLLSRGNSQVVLCERGIRTHSDATRFTLDLGAVLIAKERTHLPVIVDPSHAMGRREFVSPMALAAAAVGADGIIVEVHPHPEVALSDGPQALTPAMFKDLMGDLERLLTALGRQLAPRVGPRGRAPDGGK